MHINTTKGWLLVVQSGRISLEVLLCFIWANFLYQEGQSAFGCLYLYQQLFPFGAWIRHAYLLSDGPECMNVVQIKFSLYIFP